MSNKKFTNEEINLLSKNKYVLRRYSWRRSY